MGSLRRGQHFESTPLIQMALKIMSVLRRTLLDQLPVSVQSAADYDH